MEWRGSKLQGLWLIFFILIAFFALGQNKPLNTDKWEKLRKGMEYYEKSPPPVENRNMSPSPLGLSTWYEMVRIFLLIVLITAVAFLIVRLILKSQMPFGNKNHALDQEKQKGMPTAQSSMEELWSYYQMAKNKGDFKECIRILYQITLKKLAENNWITTRAEKTNMDYIDEIEKGEVADAFIQLTDIHEYSWYGNPNIGTAEFSNYEPRFLNFIYNSAIEKK